MNNRLHALLLPILLLLPGVSNAAFDLAAWKLQYGTALTPAAFYSSRPGPWGDYFSSTSVDCANATFLYLGPLGIKARPFDQALSTTAFSALYPATLVDSSGLIQNSFGVLDIPAGAPSDGKVYPGDVILEMEGQRIKTAAETTFPFPIQAKDSRGLEIHAGQLVDSAEGRGAIKLKILRAGLNAYTGTGLTAPATSAEVSLPVSGQDFVRLTTVSANNCLANWINPRLEDGLGGVLYLNTQAIVQKSGYATPQMGKDATGATVVDGATAITNVIGTRNHSMIEYAVPAGYTTLKFKVQASGSGSMIPSIRTRKTSIATTPAMPRQFDGNGAPVLPPELAPYIETVEYPIPQIGSFGNSYNPDSEKIANYGAILAHRLAIQQNADGSWPSAGGDYAEAHFRTALAGLGLLATGDPAYSSHIQKAATFVAANNPGGWAYPRGTRLMFLAEYYLRTRDAAILPGLQKAVTDAQEMITADFACGHGLNMGYGGAGYIGATGTVGTGLAIASKTPVVVDLNKLDNLLERVQELAGGNGGQLPYSRGGIGRNSFPETPSAGQSYSCGAGGVLATKIRGGPQYITELFRKKFGQATTYGDADGGHASEALTFIMGSLACQIWGDDSHKANMDRFLWRLTLKRDYSGYINLNTNRLEYHGGDAGCHGGPTYDTGGYLILLNSHRHNLAITGLSTAQAQAFPNTPPTYDVDRKLYWRVLGDWNMVDAALGSKMPASLQPKLAELRSMPLGIDLADRTLAFLQREALAAANLVNAIPGLASPERQHYCEMLLGIGHAITVASIDDPVPTTGLSNYQFSVNGYNATSTWDSWGGPTLASDPASTTRMTGSVTLTDPSGTYLATPRVLAFTPASLNPTTTFQVPVDQQVNMTATISYTVGGSLPISYTREIIINPAVPFNVDSRAGDYTNVRKVWIPGNCPIPFEKWNMPIQLPSGETLPGASKNEGTIGFHTYDNGALVTADNAYKTRIRGNPAGYWVTSADRWGECAALGVNVLQGPVLTTTAVSAITPTAATSGANITSDSGWPVTRRGICWSTVPYPTIFDHKTDNGTATGTFPADLTNLLPGTVYHVRAYATNAIGTAYGENLTFSTSGSSGTWTTAGGGSWSGTSNWLNGIDASGADGIADFGTVNPPSDPTITLDGPRSIGGLVFGNGSFTGNWIVGGGSLTLDIGISGNPTVTVNGGSAVIHTVLDGTDGLVKAGTGTLVLNASNIYTGLTAVNAGTLQVGGSLSAGSPVVIAAAAALTGTGVIGGDTAVAGTLAPGIGGPGTLTINGSLSLAGTTLMEINKSAATHDKVAGMSSITFGGTLTVANLSGTPAAGDTYTLFTAESYNGAFATLNLPFLAPGLEWDTSRLAVNGSIQVGIDAAITSHPANQTVGQGVSASFSVTATGIPAPAYQWQSSTNGGSSWTDIPGATSATCITAPAMAGDNNKLYHCVVANALAAVTSNPATLTVTANSLPAFTSQPADAILSAANQTATFTVAATGTPTPGLQWQVSTNFGGSWTNVSGATNPTYSFTAAAGDDNKAYRCVATNSQGGRNSDMALLLIATVPTWINAQGGSWPVATNWSGNTVASGTGITADFSRLDLPGNTAVTLDGARTVGNLKFGDVTSAFGWTLASGGTLTLATSSGTPTITVTSTSATINAVLAGTNGLAKAGSGNLVLTSGNTYTGGTTLTAGQLTINHSNALGGGALAITGGTLGNSSGSTLTLGGAQNWNGNFTYAGPDNLTISGGIALGANRTVTVNGGDLTVSGPVSGPFSLTKAGSNTLTLSGAGTYSGGTVVNAGKLLATGGGWYGTRNIGTGSLTVNGGATAQFTKAHGFGVEPGGRAAILNGGTLQFDAENYLSSLAMTGGSIIGNGEIRFGSSITVPINASSTGSVLAVGLNLVSGTTTLNVANGAAAVDLLVSDGIYNIGNLVKSGAGFMKLTGAGTYSGTTNISAGTLQLAGGSIGGGNVTVASGATLTGSGSVSGATTINGPLVPGVDGATGTLAFSSALTLASTSQTTIKTGKTGGTLSNDLITAGGTVTCGGTLTVTASGDPFATGDTLQLFSAGAISGTFSTVTLPALSGGLVWDTSRLYIDGSITLGKKPQTISFDPLPGLFPGDVLALSASATSGLMINYSSSNPAVALLQFGDYLTAIGTGTTTITASQSGNAYYSAAADVGRDLTVSATLPAVSTVAPVIVNNSTANTGGSNIWDGGSIVTERGVCWNTNPNPTVANNRTIDGAGTGSFTSTASGLVGNTTYYLRAYAKNALGYGYGGTATIVTPPGAVNGVWIQNAGGSWPTGSNWSGGTSPNGLGSTASFATVNITGNRTVTLDSAVTLSGLTFGDTTATHNWTLNAGTGGSLFLDTYSGTPAITVNNQNTTVGVPISGNKGLLKAGSGTLAFGAPNTFTGGLTVNAGILQLKPADYANSLTSGSQVIINNGGTVQVGAINSIGNSIAFTVNSGGILTFQPYHCHVVGLTLNGGSITTTGSGKYASEDFALDVNATVGGSSASSITLTNGIGIGAGSRTITVADATGSPATDLTLSGAGALRNSGTFIKAGPGTMTITNANLHTGGTVVSGGTLLASNSAGSATGTGPVTVSPGATLGGTGTISGAVSIAGSLSPGNNSVGTLTTGATILTPGSGMVWQISNWTAAAGTGYDRLVSSSLDITATAASKLTIIVSPVSLANFTDGDKDFTLVQTTGGITGFDAAGFAVDSTSFTAGNGTWTVAVSGNDLVLQYRSVVQDPSFILDPISGSGALVGTPYSGTIADQATDPNGDTLTYSKVSGPAWLSVAGDGTLTGTPSGPDTGLNTFTVRVTDTAAHFDETTLQIAVIGTPTWVNAAGGNWPNTGNWQAGYVGTGTDVTADFGTLNLSTDATVTLDGARPVGHMVFADTTPSHNWLLNTGTAGPLTLDVTTGIPTITVANHTATIGAAITGTDGLAKTGSGTLVLSGANTYTGGTTIHAGILQAGSTTAFGSSSGASLTFGENTTGTARLNSNSMTVTGLTTGTVVGSPVIENGSSGTAILTVNNAVDSTYAGALQDGATGSLALTKSGPGTLTLSGTGSYSGNTELLGGKLSVGALGSLGLTASLAVKNGATFEYTGSGAETFTRNFWLDLGTANFDITQASANLVFTPSGGNLNKSLVKNGPGSLTLNTGISAGGSVTVNNGTLTLAGTNGYTAATTVNGGTLNLAGSLPATSIVTVASGATLSGIGIAAGQVSMTGSLAPGNSVGNLTTGALTLAPSSGIAFQMSDWDGVAGTGHDTITSSSINLTATQAGPVEIVVTAVSLVNFTNSSKSFTLATTSGGITGFAANKFSIDATAIPAANGKWEVRQSGNNLLLTYTPPNNAPVFTSPTLTGTGATQGMAYTATLAGTATDPDPGDTFTFSKVSGPGWLGVAENGDLTGTPGNGDSGSQAFMVRVTDAGGLHADVSLEIQVTPGNPDANGNGILDVWEAAMFGNADPGNNAALGDADKDGISNLMEFALGTNPTEANASPLTHDIEPVGLDRYLRLTVPKNPAATNLNYTVEVCGDLASASWTTEPTEILEDSSTLLRVRDTVAIESTPRRFIRLKVTAVP